MAAEGKAFVVLSEASERLWGAQSPVEVAQTRCPLEACTLIITGIGTAG